MRPKSDGLAIRVRCYADADAVRGWLRPEVVVETLLGPLEADGYLARVTHLTRDFAPPEPIATLASSVHAWGYELVSLFAGDPDDPSLQIFLGLEPVGPRFAVVMTGIDPTFRSDAARWVPAWSRALARDRVRLATARFEPARALYERPIPPRTSLVWSPGSLDQYAGRAWHRADPECAAVLARLEHASLPPGASRTVDDEVVHVAFSADLHDARSVAAARTAHEAWLTPLVPTTVDAGWNEHGDRVAGPSARRIVEGLTFYDDAARTGYQALVVFPDGTIDTARWASAAAIVRARALSDGTPVENVRLIVPRREDALALDARARAAGFELVAYGLDGQLWQVPR